MVHSLKVRNYGVCGNPVRGYIDPTKPDFEFTQEANKTVYVPPGWMHEVETLSSSSILVGQTQVTQASITGILGII